MWQTYLMLAREIAAERVREAQRERLVRETRQATPRRPVHISRRPLDDRNSG